MARSGVTVMSREGAPECGRWVKPSSEGTGWERKIGKRAFLLIAARRISKESSGLRGMEEIEEMEEMEEMEDREKQSSSEEER